MSSAYRNSTTLNETSKQKEEEEEWEKEGRKGLVEEDEKGKGEGRGEEAVSAFKELTIQQRSNGKSKSNKSMNAKQYSREHIDHNEMKNKGHDRVR